MSKYLKKFENHAQYDAYINGSGAILPNVSICATEGDVHYNPYVEPIETRVVAKFNVIDTSSPTPIGYNQYTSDFSEIEIDGVVQPSVVSAYTFNTTGEHTVKYTLTNPTTIGTSAFANCSSLTSIIIPNSVTSIGSDKPYYFGVFYNCTSLTSIIIPNSVTFIGMYIFRDCSNLTSITSLAMTAPTIDSSTFYDINNGGTLTVPSGSSGYDVWMGTGDYYLGKYNWTKVEQ